MDGDEFDSSFADDHITDTFTPDPSGDDLHDASVDDQSHDGHYDHHDGDGHHGSHHAGHHHDDGSHHDGSHHDGGHGYHEDAHDNGAHHDGSNQDAGYRGGSQGDPCAPPDPCAATHVDESPFSDVPTTSTGRAVPSTTTAADAPETTTAETEPAPLTAPIPAPATTSPDTITIGGDIPDGFQGLLNDTPDPIMTELSRIDPNSPNAAAVAQMLGQVGMEQEAMAQTWTVPGGVGVEVDPTGTGLDYSSLDGEIFGTSTDAAEHNSDV